MTLKETFIKTLTVYRRNFAKLFIPLLVMQLLIFLPLLFFTMPGTINALRALLKAISSISQEGASVSSSIFPVFGYILLMMLFFSPLIVGNTVHVVDCDSHGKRVSWRAAATFSGKNYFAMLKAYFATIVLAMPVFFYVALVLSHFFMIQFDPMKLDFFRQFLIVSAALALMGFILGTVFVPYVVTAEKKTGFPASFASFRYLYRGNFLPTLGRLAVAAGIVGAGVFLINWLAQMPFIELFDLYLVDRAAALQEPLMVFAILLAILAIFLVALIMPFWYAFSYYTYRSARQAYEERHGPAED